MSAPREGLNEAKGNSGKEQYSHFAEMDLVNSQELLIGIDCEMQKDLSIDKREAAKRAIKCIKKNPIYYTMEYLAGVPGAEAKYDKGVKPEDWQMKEVGKDLVDKKMNMKPVKGINSYKKDADAKDETNIPVKGITLMSLVAKTVRGVKKLDPTGEKVKVIRLKEEFDPELEGEPSDTYKQFVSQKRGEEERAKLSSETHNGIRRGDKVKIDPEAAEGLGLNSSETYTVINFISHGTGLLKSVDADLGNGVEVNIKYLIPIPKTFTSSVNLNKANLMNMIKEELYSILNNK
jgi:hypothetical protein